ncbi:Fc.00g053100.m01.CDS01 [Cosmosporella sp. VM-42]
MSTGDVQDEKLQEHLITYEKLQAIEDDFEEVELEILRQQDKLTKDIYTKRQEIIADISNFWPLVLEQAPPDIDEYIQPSDSALLQSLVSLSVDRFELPNGDPRSVNIKWEFKENEWFEDKVLEKKFSWRYAKDGWSGLVSEPVDIKWKEGKDLTSGMLGLVKKVWEEEKAGKEGESEAAKKLKEQMESTGLGGLSFFAWFGFRGRKISEEEHEEALKHEQEKRKLHKEGKECDHDHDDDDDDEDDDEYEMEIFPTADDLAVCIAEDLWPGAIKYFTNAQEQDEMSDMDFESDEEMDDEEEKEDPPNKKRKA